mgnify:CR=1 FL=1
MKDYAEFFKPDVEFGTAASVPVSVGHPRAEFKPWSLKPLASFVAGVTLLIGMTVSASNPCLVPLKEAVAIRARASDAQRRDRQKLAQLFRETDQLIASVRAGQMSEVQDALRGRAREVVARLDESTAGTPNKDDLAEVGVRFIRSTDD